MLNQRTRMDEGYSNIEVNPSHQPLSVVRPCSAKASPIPPLFDLIEEEDYYLMSVDLPGIPDLGGEIEVRKGEIQVTHRQSTDQLTSNILLRCRSRDDRVRAVYFEGALWLLLPKQGRSAYPRATKARLDGEIPNSQQVIS